MGPSSDPVDFLELGHQAAAAPDGAALASPGRLPLTYASLWDHVSAASEELCRAGLRPGTVAALALPSEASFVTAVLAVTLRSASTPLDPSLTRDECVSYLQRLGALTLIAPQGASSPAADVAGELGMNVIRICSAKESAPGLFKIAEIQAPRREFTPRETDAAFILMTSSTTGPPKLVPWSRANVRAAVRQDINAFELNCGDRFLALMPFHSSHSVYTLLTQLACGGLVGCPSSLNAADLFAAFESFRPTWISAGPAIHHMLLAHARENPDFFRQIPLRFVRSAGAPPEQDLLATLETLLGAPVLDSYGLTEIPGVARNTPRERKQGSLGKSVGADLAILDDPGNLLPPGTQGEIAARGPTLMSGYLDDPEANHAAFHNGWFRTGDIGQLDQDGFLFLAGRKKEMINRGGSKISPREVDDVLARHPAIADVAAFAIPHRTLGEEIAAAVVLKASAEASELELRRYSAEHLAAYKVPRRVVFLESIPRTAVGRPKRGELTEQFRTVLPSRPALQPGSPEVHRPPTEIETRLIAIWRQILGVEGIGLEESFFDLGGDSLSASLMLTQVEAAFEMGGYLDGSEFFEQPTVAMLAAIVVRHSENTEQEIRGNHRILVYQKDGDRNPFFCISASTFSPYFFRHLCRALGREQPLVVICPPRAGQSQRLLNAQEVARQSMSAIRELRKHGPYLIGGYCYGGVVAFEIASQLLEEGEEVAVLVLMDTPTPGYPKVLRQWKRYMQRGTEILRGLARGKASITFKDVFAHLGVIVHMKGRRVGAKVNRALASPTATSPLTDEMWNAVVMREYVPRAFPSRIVQFLASDIAVSTTVLDDPRLGWRDFARGGFETCPVRGDHLSMLDKTNAPALAAELERVLEEAAVSTT